MREVTSILFILAGLFALSVIATAFFGHRWYRLRIARATGPFIQGGNPDCHHIFPSQRWSQDGWISVCPLCRATAYYGDDWDA